ncbi:MAG: PQQ-binding-like beta-propeller repeat protein [Planctomycetes bacterium]|nr:PQQ-binding-like beta-propeller repeat protein [Planctomycetota bacterium]MBL7038767.1 PQQ-binding-like beta-propeller repeat protein [Pirellulaceae bacterium]
MKQLSKTLCVSIAVLEFAAIAAAVEPAQLAEQILDATDMRGGFVLHLGCGDGALTACLAADDRYVVHGMDGDAANVAKARKRIANAGLEAQATVEHFSGDVLPFIDNLVNLVVADDLGKVSMREIDRVLAPGGAMISLQSSASSLQPLEKPRPKEIDHWTHYMHGPDGNAVAADALVGPPRRLQWLAGPAVARHHDVTASISAVVSDGPRIYYIIDEGPPSLMNFPPDWKLVARDAFNGVLLWKRPIPTWANYLRPFRSGPPQLPRRLVAVGGKVFATLELDAPVSILDATSGETLRVFEETRGADEILVIGDVLLVVTNDLQERSDEAARRGVPPAESPRLLMAVSAETGQVLWKKSGTDTAKFQPMTVAAAANCAVFQRGTEVVCVNAGTGNETWTFDLASSNPQTAPPKKPAKGKSAKKPARKKKSIFGAPFFAPTIVICEQDGVVLASDRGKLTALSLDRGQPLWSCPSPPDFHAPADVFLADGLVWSGIFATHGRDPQTGEVKRTIDISGLLTPGHHARCYRNKATHRFVIADKRGMEYFDLTGQQHARNNWVRGVCQYGVMPCNGMTYVPPNACCCYAGVILRGFTALLPHGNTPSKSSAVLEQGPAYGVSTKADTMANEWPTYRGDILRSGATSASIPVSLKKTWDAKIGGKLTAPVVGGGRVFVASVNDRRITALDEKAGAQSWAFTAGGRVDTPPTLHHGTLLFGSNDGWVYCLSAVDGQLAWRFRAAPEDRRTMVDSQLESVWPVHGNVLVMGGVAYFAAGRSVYLDGGIWLYGVDTVTGRKMYDTRVFVPHEEAPTRTFTMAGARPDVLVSDGKYIYLQQIKFDTELNRQEGLGRHLMTNSGLTDDTWFYRTFWRLGYGDVYDFPFSYIKHDLQVPFGQLLVFDDRAVCGLQTFMSPGIVPSGAAPSSRGCLLFADANQPFTPDKKTSPTTDYPVKVTRPKTPVDHKWTVKVPFQARAMLLADNALFVGGWPDDGPAAELYAARAGDKAGYLWIISPDDGKKIAEQKLESSPVFDGMAAASERLFVSLKNGKLVCFGK